MNHSCKYSVFLQTRSQAPKSRLENESIQLVATCENFNFRWSVSYYAEFYGKRQGWSLITEVKTSSISEILEITLFKSAAFWIIIIREASVFWKQRLKILLFFFIWKDVAASSDTHCLFDCCKFFYLSILLDAHAAWPPVSLLPQSFSNVNSDKQKYWSELTVVWVFHSICEISRIWLPSKGWKVFFCLMVNLFFSHSYNLLYFARLFFPYREHCLLPRQFSHSVFPSDYLTFYNYAVAAFPWWFLNRCIFFLPISSILHGFP